MGDKNVTWLRIFHSILFPLLDQWKKDCKHMGACFACIWEFWFNKSAQMIFVTFSQHFYSNRRHDTSANLAEKLFFDDWKPFKCSIAEIVPADVSIVAMRIVVLSKLYVDPYYMNQIYIAINNICNHKPLDFHLKWAQMC